MSAVAWLNTAWMLKCGFEARAFCRATRDVEATQAAVLREILQQSKGTEFARRHRCGGIRTPRQYQQQVPLSTYEDYQRAIERIAAGERSVLTRERVELLQPTSGTSKGEKLIPYTRLLRREF